MRAPAWQRALEAARLPLYDVHWPAAVVIEKGRDRKTGANVLRVGLARWARPAAERLGSGPSRSQAL